MLTITQAIHRQQMHWIHNGNRAYYIADMGWSLLAYYSTKQYTFGCSVPCLTEKSRLGHHSLYYWKCQTDLPSKRNHSIGAHGHFWCYFWLTCALSQTVGYAGSCQFAIHKLQLLKREKRIWSITVSTNHSIPLSKHHDYASPSHTMLAPAMTAL